MEKRSYSGGHEGKLELGELAARAAEAQARRREALESGFRLLDDYYEEYLEDKWIDFRALSEDAAQEGEE